MRPVFLVLQLMAFKHTLVQPIVLNLHVLVFSHLHNSLYIFLKDGGILIPLGTEKDNPIACPSP